MQVLVAHRPGGLVGDGLLRAGWISLLLLEWLRDAVQPPGAGTYEFGLVRHGLANRGGDVGVEGREVVLVRELVVAHLGPAEDVTRKRLVPQLAADHA